MKTKCTCERPDDNTCEYCEKQSSIQILEEAAAKFYREYPTNPLYKPERHYNRDVDCFKKRKAFVNGAKYMAERMYSEEEMRKAFIEGHNVCRCVTDNIDEAKECFEEWFEQNEKTR